MPKPLDPLRRLFRLATGRARIQADVDDELDLHLAMAEDEWVERGLSREDARRRVGAAFGDRRQIARSVVAIDRSRIRANRWEEMMDKWRSDLRLAVRGLARDRWFAGSAIGLVALALGANIAVFSVFNAAFFQRLPYPEIDRIVTVSESKRGRENRVAGLNLRDWQAMSREFTHLSGYQYWDMTLLAGERPEIVSAAMVSNSFAGVMGIAPMTGRWFSKEESRVGGPGAAVLSERLWRDRFGADPAAIGSVVRIEGHPVTIVGVMPATLDFPVGVDVWTPLEPFDDTPSRSGHNWQAIGRLVPGIEPAEASRRLSLLTQQLVANEPAADAEFLADGAIVAPLRERLLGQSDRIVGLLQAAVGLLLVIAMLNLAALLLARTAKRQAEVAMTVTLGASRRDLVRRFALESLVVTGIGTLVGLVIWMIGRGALLAGISSLLPFVHRLPLDGRLVGATVAAAIVVGLAAGLIPALWVARSVDQGGAHLGSQRVVGPARVMQGLLAAEVAATFVLLFGTALLTKSLARFVDQPLGYGVEQRTAMAISLPTNEGSPYRNADRHRAVFAGLEQRIAQLPGVLTVGSTTATPLRDGSPNGSARIQGEISGSGGPPAVSDFRVVSPGFFETMGVPILRGRGFTTDDGANAPYVVVVSEAFARVHLRGENPIGRQVRFPGMDQIEDDAWATVVGVVGDTRHYGPGDRFEPTVYYDYRQRPQIFRTMTVIAHVSGPTEAVEDGMRQALAAIEPTVPFVGGPLAASLGDLVAGPRSRTLVLGSFASAALLLAGLGLFGVVGFVVLRRTRELGVRLALGASAATIAAAAVRHAAWPALLGIVFGAGISAVAARVAQGLVFEVSPTDPPAFLWAALAVAVTATLACLGPVRRALKIDPAIALRSE